MKISKLACGRMWRGIGLGVLGAACFQLAGCISTLALLQLAEFSLRGLLVLLVGEPIE
jgi:hypothetical protein